MLVTTLNKSLSKTVHLSIDLYCLRENIFCFSKTMEIFIQSIDPDAWNGIIKGPCIPTKEVNGDLIPNEWNEMRDDKKIKVQDDKKAKIFSLLVYLLMNSFVL